MNEEIGQPTWNWLTSPDPPAVMPTARTGKRGSQQLDASYMKGLEERVRRLQSAGHDVDPRQMRLPGF